MVNCLGLGLLCNEYFTVEYSFFGITGLLTVIGIFFAGFQLIKPIHIFRLRNKGITNIRIFWTICISICLSFVGIVLPYISGKALPLIGYSVFWEMLSLLFIVVPGLICIFMAVTPFKKISNIERFLNILISFLGKGGKRTNAVGSEIGDLIYQIVKLSDSNVKNAHIILRILMDKGLIDNIVNEQMFTLDKILEVYVNRKKVGEQYIDMLQEEFISTIIDRSLNSNNSIISRELRGDLYAGINRGRGIISQRIFETFEFISRYDLLTRKWFAGSCKYNDEKTEDYATNYSKFRDLAMESFFRQERDNKGNIINNHIVNNLKFYKDLYKGIKGFCGYKGILTDNYKNHNVVSSILHKIEFGIGENAKEILEYYKENIPPFKVDNMIGMGREEPSNFFEAIALGSYQLLETISHIEETEENVWNIRHLIRNSVLDSMGGDDDSKKIFHLIKERLNYLILKQISENNIRGYYPNMTRNFFHLYGWQIFTNKINDEDNAFCLEVLKLLEDNLPKLNSGIFWGITEKNDNIDKDLQEARKAQVQKIISDILPYGIIYNEKDNTLTYYFGSKLDKAVLALSEVKNGRIVILDNLEK